MQSAKQPLLHGEQDVSIFWDSADRMWDTDLHGSDCSPDVVNVSVEHRFRFP